MILLYQRIKWIIIFAVLGVFFTSCEKVLPKTKVNSSDKLVKVVHLASLELKNRFELGNMEEYLPSEFNCPQLLSLSEKVPQYLRCNRNYLECFYSGKTPSKNTSIQVKLSGKIYKVKVLNKFENLKYTKLVAKSVHAGTEVPAYGVMVLIQVPELSLELYPIVLKNTCEMTYLPQRVYEILSIKNKKKIFFDNFSKDYFIDKYLVRNLSINEWKEIDANTKDLEPRKDPSKYQYPATNLSRVQQEQFCQFRGKRLLEAHIFDAATFLPNSNKEDQRPLRRSVFPWKMSKSLIADLKGIKTLKYASKENCQKIYSKECLSEHNYNGFNDKNISWAGIFEVMGGPLESLNNIYEPELNLKISSKYFSIREREIHKLGVRAKWNGQGLATNSFNFVVEGKDFSKSITSTILEVGFRCMKEIANENK